MKQNILNINRIEVYEIFDSDYFNINIFVNNS